MVRDLDLPVLTDHDVHVVIAGLIHAPGGRCYGESMGQVLRAGRRVFPAGHDGTRRTQQSHRGPVDFETLPQPLASMRIAGSPGVEPAAYWLLLSPVGRWRLVAGTERAQQVRAQAPLTKEWLIPRRRPPLRAWLTAAPLDTQVCPGLDNRPMTPNAVRRLRARLGLTQTRFAALLGVHKITVAKWEGGTKGMSFTSKRLLRVLAQHGPKALAPPPRPGTTRRRRGKRT